MYLRVIAIAIAIAIAIVMAFLEIQTIFEQLSAIFPENLKQLNSDLTPLLLALVQQKGC